MTAQDNFDFKLIGTDENPFVGYISANDPTRVTPRAMVRGSRNVILENTGNIINRDGLKRYDPADNTQDPVVASYDWEDSDGNTLLVRVLESGKLQFYRTSNETWYTLDTFDKNNFIFKTWWDSVSSKEVLVMVNGDSNLYGWSGGITNSIGSVDTGNSILINATSPVESITFSDVQNDLTDVISTSDLYNRYAGIVFDANPSNGSILSIAITSTSPFKSGTGFIQFVNHLTTPLSNTSCQILIGATKEETASRLFYLLQNPSSDTINQKGFVDSDLIAALGYPTYSAVSSLESGSTKTWAEQGFIEPGDIIVDGVSYSYTIIIGRWLVNISGTPTAGSFGYSAIITTTDTPSDTSTNDFILVLNNQLILCSYTSRIVYISASDDYTNFVNTGDVVRGDPDFFIIDEFPIGGVVKGQSAYIGGGVSSWYEVTPNTAVAAFPGVVYTMVNKFSGAGLSAPLGPNFVSTVGEDIIYLGQDNQLRTLGFYRNVFQQKSPSLSFNVRAELQEEDFTGGCIRTVDEYTYIISPISGKTYLYQIRDNIDNVGNISSVRQWQPPQEWNISRIAIINGIVHGYSAQTPQLYQLWDTGQWHDDTSVDGEFSPYTSVLRFAYRQFAERSRLGNFDKIFYEGYIEPYTDLSANIYYDYRGATRLEQKVLSSVDSTPVLFGGEGVILIGNVPIGNTTIGGGLRDVDYSNSLSKFRAITNVIVDNCFEYQLELVSEELDARWQLLSIGANASAATNKPTNLQLPQI